MISNRTPKGIMNHGKDKQASYNKLSVTILGIIKDLKEL